WKCSHRMKLVLLMLLAILLSSCQANGPVTERSDNRQAKEITEPTIEATPISKADDQWQVVSSDNITLNVTAPEARSVKILYRPAFAEGRHVELKTLNAPADSAAGRFSTQLKVPSDFAGDVWAEAYYRNGSKKETKPISLTVESMSADELAGASYKHTEESARSDKITGGRIDQTSLQPGNGDIHITVNIPAFQLTFWQGNKEVKLYQIGIGRKEFPLPSGLRYAKQVVFNPEWIPPDSSWVEEHDVVPGERVEADDPRNPLGKVKIPLGNGGILIHQAFKPRDIGHLVSHGCVRVELNELYELIDKIVAARSLSASKQKLDEAKSSKDRFVIKLDVPLVVDINYDTQVVEGGVLHLYPDVYNKKTNTVENLRAELQDFGIDESRLDDKTLQQMLDRVTMSEEFVVSIADIKAGRALAAGKTQPLTAASVGKKPTATVSPRRR
ncbi:MAG TPA: L,D-transpeptidase, partial [Pyrinomonadaceae bacterium]|nr:L,D-transpeptidase [Pyrinomonadaceae bacterium]